MSREARGRILGPMMVVKISFESGEPPRGRAELCEPGGSAAEEFVGWLGLLQVIYELLGAGRSAAAHDSGVRRAPTRGL